MCITGPLWGESTGHWWIPRTKGLGQWHRAVMFSLICTWTNAWANTRDAGDLRCHDANYDVTVMPYCVTRAQWVYWYRLPKPTLSLSPGYLMGSLSSLNRILLDRLGNFPWVCESLKPSCFPCCPASSACNCHCLQVDLAKVPCSEPYILTLNRVNTGWWEISIFKWI